MSRNAIRLTIILGVISIIGIISIQVYFIQKSFNMKEKQLDQSLHIALRNVAEAICRYNNTTLPYANPVLQQTPDYFIVDVNSVIDANVLEYSLTNELEKRNLQLDYEYAIYDCETNAMVYGDYVKLTEGDKEIVRDYYLPACDDFIYYFGVHFPGRKEYLIKTMGIWIFLSAILLVVVVFFGYTQFVILRQRRLSEIQKDFINNITHEFKTPLTSISLSSDVLSEPGILEEPQRLMEYVEIIKNQSGYLQEHVENVLRISGSEKKHHTLNKETLNLNSILEDIISGIKPRIEKEGGEIATSLDNRIPRINADKSQFMAAVLNILDNSIKYCVKAPEILIKSTVIGEKTILTITDNGCGIQKRYIRRVFDKFFRVPTGNVHNIKGFGLGLTYVRKIADLHNWKVAVESDGRSGTSIIFTIT